MRKEYDFTDAKRAKEVPHLVKLQAEAAKGKTRITIYLDDDVLNGFRDQAEKEGKGYQTLINETLRNALKMELVTLDALRQLIREELHHV